ncbi:MAG TPA: DUF1499 domain-containing protein [Sulfitobacter sp.]|nr:DUF1499 domain-containing protein [Sulfitobacter sp.]
MRMFSYLLISLAVAFAAYVRLAPSDPSRWHISIPNEGNIDLAGGAVRIVPNSPDVFERLIKLMSKLPRTTVLAGTVDEGHLTYITRSKLMGYPDYTTIERSDETIKIFARLRFGKSDLGVNAARLEQLKGALE